MPQGDFNDTIRMLIDIQKDVSATKTKVEDIEEKLNQVDSIDEKAEKSLAKSVENGHQIDRLTNIQNWLIGILISGIGVTILIYIIEKFL
ncbi:holin [Levilactobacillus brevis]|uniref:hemolysin XhlA family protein n=1 Tax=Levilactobacillus brevis TaxID=1580 RepID=UPI000A20B25D|nr:hemolysin XhlA family protein [Levilactobacillus brevis]ARN92875.1 holin [Levilactobacillus brevis]ARN95518.1 holin [Levilactobacillus brevis]MBS0978660.1 hemolysin XhlA family protein [Levilactobacillus brevis]